MKVILTSNFGNETIAEIILEEGLNEEEAIKVAARYNSENATEQSAYYAVTKPDDYREANGKSGWEKDDWENDCQKALLHHIRKGDPRDVAAYCAFMDHHGWMAKSPLDVRTIVYLREVDAGTDNACWVVCAKGDKGAWAFAPLDFI